MNHIDFSWLGRFVGWCWRALRGALPFYVSLYRGRAWYVRLCVAAVSSVVALLLWLGAVDINFLWLFGRSPGFGAIVNPPSSEASEVYSSDGVLIGKFFNENRTHVDYGEVSEAFWQSLIDTEDERFYRHFGIDFQGIGAALKDVVLHRTARGASTITQQLAKNMFRVRTNYSTGLVGKIPGLKMLIMKTKEWIIALKLEMVYDKRQILTMYANTVDFGSNSFGIKTASRTYFNVLPSELTVEQASVLVGMLKATTTYNPLHHPENSQKRRNVVMENMVRCGHLDRSDFDSLKSLPIRLHYNVESNYDGQAKYFREAIANELDDWCTENGYDLYTSGLKIYTSIDTRMQRYAEAAARQQMRQVQENFDRHWGSDVPWRDEQHRVIPTFIEDIAKRLPVYEELSHRYGGNTDSIMAELNRPHKVKVFDYEQGTVERELSTLDSIRYMVRFMHCSFVAMEPETGHVKAWVGDVDFNSWKYDKVTAMRQPGSTFKLFVYTEAMNQGLTPCDKRRDEYISMDVYDKKKKESEIWTPTNASGVFSGDSMPLKSAFAKSINSVAVRLGQEMGIKNIISTAHDMGIKSELEDAPSLALGSSDVTLLELVNAYGCIANNGVHTNPVLVTRIVDKDGKEVYVAPTVETRVVPYKSAFFMQQMLMAGMREHGGTSMAMNAYTGGAYDTDFGGKTGTSNNHSDAWFMCVSPHLVCGAWVGGEYRCIHFRTGALGQGSRTALPICGLFVQSVMNDKTLKKYHGRFKRPSDKDVRESYYNCAGYTPQPKDSTENDSLGFDDADVIYDEEGNAIPIQGEIIDPIENGTEDELEKKSEEKQVTFEDL